jgi:hypothetical protein
VSVTPQKLLAVMTFNNWIKEKYKNDIVYNKIIYKRNQNSYVVERTNLIHCCLGHWSEMYTCIQFWYGTFQSQIATLAYTIMPVWSCHLATDVQLISIIVIMILKWKLSMFTGKFISKFSVHQICIWGLARNDNNNKVRKNRRMIVPML